MQNTSHAVMSAADRAPDSLDEFPTPPWAARALVHYALKDRSLGVYDVS
jgi:hypothetical protein